jgi:hypothetical protein
MKVVRPIEFIWCGILYIPGRTPAYWGSEPFVGELIGKLNTFSQVKEGAENFTLDVIWQGASDVVRDETREGMRVRGSFKRRHELEGEQALLKPDTDCMGPRFVQVAIGDIEFLLAVAHELRSEDGWPDALADDVEDAIDLLTKEKSILCFIRPQVPEPFLISADFAPLTPEEHEQRLH